MVRAYQGRGSVYYQQKKWQLALDDYNEAIDLEPNYTEAYYGRGLVYAELRNKQKAIENLKIAAQLFQKENNIISYLKIMNVLKDLER